MKKARKGQGISQKKVASLTGIDQSYISRLENGVSEGSPCQLKAIADAIGVPVALFFGEPDERALKLSWLSDEAIELATEWQKLPADQREAIRGIVRALPGKK